jgi:hypothetical protein
VLDHDDGISASGYARSSHDFDASTGLQDAFKNTSRAKLADTLKLRARRDRIRGPYRESVTSGTMEGRIIAVRTDRFRQHAPKGLFDFDGFSARRPLDGHRDLDDFVPRVGIGQHGNRELNPPS